MLSKTALLENRIIDDIRSGYYLPGEKIPSRNRLASRHNCSRTTVERAVAALVRSGQLQCRQGSGTYVLERHEHSLIRKLNVVATNPVSLEQNHSELFFYEDFLKLPTRWFSCRHAPEHIETLSAPDSATIWLQPAEDQISLMDYLRRKHIPQLLINREYRNYDRIYTEPASSLREGLAWLMIEAGRNITFVSQSPSVDRPYLSGRIIAFYQVCVELGAQLHSNMLFMMNDSSPVSDEITRVGMRLFTHPGRPRGIFVSSQDIVLELIRCGESYGMKPGRDYCLLTFDFVRELAGVPGIRMLRQPYPLMLREMQRWLAEKNLNPATTFVSALKADLV